MRPTHGLLLLLASCFLWYGCGPSVSLPGKPQVEAPPKVETQPETPKEDKRVEDADKRINDLNGELQTAKDEKKSALAERDRVKIEAQVKPVRYVFIAGSALGSLAFLGGVALYVFSLVFTSGFGSKFGLGIASIGGVVLAFSLIGLWMLSIAVAHFALIAGIAFVVTCILGAYGVWKLHIKERINLEQTKFANAAAEKLKQIEGMATNSMVPLSEVNAAALTAWQDVKGPAVARQVKNGIQQYIDKLKDKVAGT